MDITLLLLSFRKLIICLHLRFDFQFPGEMLQGYPKPYWTNHTAYHTSHIQNIEICNSKKKKTYLFK